MKQRHILAIGGAAFARPPEKPVFEQYILDLTGKKKPKILFIGTATGDDRRYVDFFYATFKRLRCTPSHLPLFERTPDLRKTILSQDAIFVGGGNTKSMLAVWRDWGIDKILKDAWKKGIVLSGVSAGAICWFEQGVTDSWADDLYPLKCLGFLKGSCCPHWSGEKDRKPRYKQMLKKKQIKPGIAIDDCAGAHFVNGTLHAIISPSSVAGAQLLSSGARSSRPSLPSAPARIRGRGASSR
jgi:peptidase E